jgi:hypothetical protein
VLHYHHDVFLVATLLVPRKRAFFDCKDSLVSTKIELGVWSAAPTVSRTSQAYWLAPAVVEEAAEEGNDMIGAPAVPVFDTTESFGGDDVVVVRREMILHQEERSCRFPALRKTTNKPDIAAMPFSLKSTTITPIVRGDGLGPFAFNVSGAIDAVPSYD